MGPALGTPLPSDPEALQMVNYLCFRLCVVWAQIVITEAILDLTSEARQNKLAPNLHESRHSKRVQKLNDINSGPVMAPVVFEFSKMTFPRMPITKTITIIEFNGCIVADEGMWRPPVSATINLNVFGAWILSATPCPF